MLITAGTSEGIELALTALVDPGDAVLVPMPTYPLYTAVLAKIGAEASYYRKDPSNGWQPDLDHIESLITPRTRALVVIDPNNPTGAVYPDAHAAGAHRAGRAAWPRAPGRRGVRRPRLRRTGEADGQPRPGRADHLVLEPLEGISGAGVARGLDGGGTNAAARRRAGRHQEARGRPAVQQRPVAVRDRAGAARRPQPPGVVPRGASQRAPTSPCGAERDPGDACVAAGRRVLRDAEGGAAPGDTDEHYVLELLRATGVLCVYGSGFGMPAGDGFFRVVFLASPPELASDLRDIDAFTRAYLNA